MKDDILYLAVFILGLCTGVLVVCGVVIGTFQGPEGTLDACRSALYGTFHALVPDL